MNTAFHSVFMLIAGLLLCGCGRQSQPLPAGSFNVQAEIDRTTARTGEPVRLVLRARHPAGSTVSFPKIGHGKEAVVLDRASGSATVSGTVLETEEVYKLVSFRPGEWTLTAGPAVCTFADGTSATQSLPQISLRVPTSLSATNATLLSDIKGPARPPLRITRLLWALAAVTVLALIAGFATLLIRRKKLQPVPSAPPLPPHQVARMALDALKNAAWAPEPFFTELSRILRTYLENRFDLNAPESTTEELTRSMAHDVRLGIKEQQTLRNFLTQADLVKFARADAEKEVMQNAFTTVEQFVEQTKGEIQEPVLPQESTENSKQGVFNG